MTQKIHAIVVHYLNGSEFQDCLESLISEKLISCVTVIDNSHLIRDEALKLPKSDIIQVVKPSSNLGYAAGNNVGIRSAIRNKDDLVLVINPDAELKPGALEQLLLEMRELDLSLISPSLIESQSAPALSKPAWDLVLGRNITDPDTTSSPNSNRFKPLFFGACFLARVDLFAKIGVLNDQLFLYGEELDLVFRMENSGYRWKISTTAFAKHLRGSSTGQYLAKNKSTLTEFHSARSMVINARNYAPTKLPVWFLSRLGYAVLNPKLSLSSRSAILGGLKSGFVPKKRE
jgi:GT2 family glycosyltransferase